MLFHSSLVAHVGLVDDCGLGIFLSILVILGLLALICAICGLFTPKVKVEVSRTVTPKVEVSGKEGKIPLSCSELNNNSCSELFLDKGKNPSKNEFPEIYFTRKIKDFKNYTA